jgi:hypothetical protein
MGFSKNRHSWLTIRKLCPPESNLRHKGFFQNTRLSLLTCVSVAAGRCSDNSRDPAQGRRPPGGQLLGSEWRGSGLRWGAAVGVATPGSDIQETRW